MRQLIKYKKFALLLILLAGFLTGGVTQVQADTSTSPCPPHWVQQVAENGLSNQQITCCPSGEQRPSEDMACFFTKYINPVIDLLSGLVGVVVVIAVIMGAIEYSSSAGDPQKANSGRQHITNALLALLAYILLYAFLEFLIPGGFLHG